MQGKKINRKKEKREKKKKRKEEKRVKKYVIGEGDMEGMMSSPGRVRGEAGRGLEEEQGERVWKRGKDVQEGLEKIGRGEREGLRV